ncbi:MAG: septation protein A [Candidatus Competibacteraceae bacterium]
MKFLFDFLPVLLFFIVYKLYDIYVATAVLIVASLAQVAWLWLRHRRIEKMPLITALLVLLLGGATLLLHDDTFVKWKPTVVNWLFALAFLGSQFIGGKTLIERMMSGTIDLPAEIWSRLNTLWVAFFILLGTANLYVAFNFDTNIWVDFKLFGMLGLTLVFVVLQSFYLARHLKRPATETSEE